MTGYHIELLKTRRMERCKWCWAPMAKKAGGYCPDCQRKRDAGQKYFVSDRELSYEYRHARNRHHQVQILADRCATAATAMAKHLVSLGFDDDSTREYINRKRRRPENPKYKTFTDLIDDLAPEYYYQGYSDQEIAEILNVSSQLVRYWRNVNGLSSNDKLSEMNEIRMSLYKQGLTDKEIAQASGVSCQAICAWRARNKLPVNRRVKEHVD